MYLFVCVCVCVCVCFMFMHVCACMHALTQACMHVSGKQCSAEVMHIILTVNTHPESLTVIAINHNIPNPFNSVVIHLAILAEIISKLPYILTSFSYLCHKSFLNGETFALFHSDNSNY